MLEKEPETSMYRIQYIDNTFQLVDWTDDQLIRVYEEMEDNQTVTMVNKSIFKLTDIRAIVYLPPIETPEEQEEIKDDENLTEWGFVDAETANWLRNNGIDVGKGGK